MSAPCLADRELELLNGMSPSDAAKRIAPTLSEIGREMQLRARSAAERELADYYAVRLAFTGNLLRVLEQEQWRQREGAKLYLHDRISRVDLRRITESWNKDDPAHD